MFSWFNLGKSSNTETPAGRSGAGNWGEPEIDGFVLVEEKEGGAQGSPGAVKSSAGEPPAYVQVARPMLSSSESTVAQASGCLGNPASPSTEPREVRSPVSDLPFSLATPLLLSQRMLQSADLASLLQPSAFQPNRYWYDFSLESRFLRDLDLSDRENQQNQRRELQQLEA